MSFDLGHLPKGYRDMKTADAVATAQDSELADILILTDDEPPVCELADMVNTTTLHWKDSADQPCAGATWLLVGPDQPSPLCDRHAQMLRDRLVPWPDSLTLVSA